jgi:hypothetical protein
MKIKRFSLRFNLDWEDDRRAWDALHRMDAQSINKEIIARINAKEQTDVLKDLIRQVVSEQLANILQGGSVQPPPQQEDCAEEIENVFDFLDSF